MSGVEWFFARDNKQQGPVSAVELRQLAQTGQVKPEDLVWREGMPDWLPAAKVKGLFEAEAARGQPKTAPLSGAVATFEASTTAFERSREGLPRHFFDQFLESARLQFTSHFVESTAKIFAVLGHVGLYVAMAVLLVFYVVLAARTGNLYLIVVALAWILVLVSLQYIADRFSAALQKLNHATPGRMSSTAFLDCWALLHMLAGLVVLTGLTLLALHLEAYSLILWAIGLFILLQFVAVLAVNPETLRIEIVSETGAGEEAIGILSFVIKTGLRMVPVAFGTGVLLGTAWMLLACWLAAMPPDDALAAARNEQPAEVAVAVSAQFGAATSAVNTGTALMALVVPVQFGPAAAAASTGTTVMVSAAAVPFAMYLIVLFSHLGIDMVQAVFSLPAKLDRMAVGGQTTKEDG